MRGILYFSQNANEGGRVLDELNIRTDDVMEHVGV